MNYKIFLKILILFYYLKYIESSSDEGEEIEGNSNQKFNIWEHFKKYGKGKERRAKCHNCDYDIKFPPQSTIANLKKHYNGHLNNTLKKPTKIWEYFTKIGEGNNRIAICNTCKEKIPFPNRSGTTNLILHLYKDEEENIWNYFEKYGEGKERIAKCIKDNCNFECIGKSIKSLIIHYYNTHRLNYNTEKSGKKTITESSSDEEEEIEGNSNQKFNIWEHFTKYISEDGEERASCNYCNFDSRTKNGVSNFRRHYNGHINNTVQKPSKIWEYFTKIGEGNNRIAKCNTCKEKIPFKIGRTNIILLKHLYEDEKLNIWKYFKQYEKGEGIKVIKCIIDNCNYNTTFMSKSDIPKLISHFYLNHRFKGYTEKSGKRATTGMLSLPNKGIKINESNSSQTETEININYHRQYSRTNNLHQTKKNKGVLIEDSEDEEYNEDNDDSD